MNKINYQKELDKIISGIGVGETPKLLLHSCCAPCSSYCMEYLREYFDITVLYYNPNISSDEEYRKRVEEEIRLIAEYNRQVDEFQKQNAKDSLVFEAEGVEMVVTPQTKKIQVIDDDYNPDDFYNIARGYEKCPEGGDRCGRCFELRLRRSFEVAMKLGMDYVTTTLTISPLKNADVINEIGYRLSEDYVNQNLLWLPSDFKKKEGYKRSTQLSKMHNLYRQNFCGCVYSKVSFSDNMV